MFKVMQNVAKCSCDYVKHGRFGRQSVFLNLSKLTIAERTLSGLVHPEKIEEMDRELTKVIEDFDRAMNVEALHLAKETSKRSMVSNDRVFSVVSCRTSPARPLAEGAA